MEGTITVANFASAVADANKTSGKVIFKNCAPFTNCISEISNAQVNNVKDLDILMPMYNLIEYCNNYSKTSGSFYQYCSIEPSLIMVLLLTLLLIILQTHLNAKEK